MVDRKNVRVAAVLLVMGAMVQLLASVDAGLRQDWTKMILMLFGFVFAVSVCMSIPLALKTEACFRGLERLVSEKLGSVPSSTSGPDRKSARKANNVVEKIAALFMILSVPIHLSLGVLAGVHEKWFRLGIHLTACAVTMVVCMVVLMMLKIGTHTKRVEELILRQTSEPT